MPSPEDLLVSWNDGPAMAAIREFVDRVTGEVRLRRMLGATK